jgi:hypothetical protein
MVELPQCDPLAVFMGREVTLKIEARGSRIETVTGRLDGTATKWNVGYLVLENGRRLIRANTVVDYRFAEDVVAEKAALAAEGP